MSKGRITSLEHALLTHDWDAIERNIDQSSTRSARLGSAVLDVRRGDYSAVLDAAPAQPTENMHYLLNVARWKLGTLSNDRGDAFADAFQRLHRHDIVTIVTIQKSGTHWMRYFLANYARLLAEPTVNEPISYKQLVAKYYGNNRWQVFRGAEPYRTPSKLLVEHGISDVTMQHFRSEFDPLVFTPGRKIMLYRNPLDFVVSLYHYMIKQRPQNRHKATHPRVVLEPMLAEYSRHLLTLNSYRNDSSVYVTSYEDLRYNALTRFSEIVRFLGLPLIDDAIDRSLALSDISTIRAMEEKAGRSMVVKLDGYFTRDGSIGKWKQFFTEADLRLARDVLADYGIELAEFVIDDR